METKEKTELSGRGFFSVDDDDFILTVFHRSEEILICLFLFDIGNEIENSIYRYV